MKIIGTGLSGLIGSRVVELLSPQFLFVNASVAMPVDVTKASDVMAYIRQFDAPWIFHFAAATDVDGIEKERGKGTESLAWQVNVIGTQHVVSAARQTGKRVLYLSTDYVFDGTKDRYTEDDLPAPQSWYAHTKYEGEKVIQTLGESGLILRISNPYRATSAGKSDWMYKIVDRLVLGQEVVAPSDQLFVPTFIDDIAHAIGILVLLNEHGIYHVVGSECVSPFAAAQKIAKIFLLDAGLIHETSFAEFMKGRAPRPFHANLTNEKVAKLGVQMSTLEEGLMNIQSQNPTLTLSI